MKTKLNQFETLFANGQVICFQHSVKSAPVFLTYPFDEKQAGAFQFFCLNPFKESASVRRASEVLYRQGFTVEMDCCSLDLQREYFQKRLGKPSIAVFSGNKSVHNHVVIETPISDEQEKEIVSLFKRAFPFADWKVLADKARLCRVPGAIRENGERQSVEIIMCSLRAFT